MNDEEIEQAARLTRCLVIKGLCEQGHLLREDALELLSGPLTPGDESTRVDDRALLGKSEAEIIAILFPDYAAGESPVLPTD